MRAVRQVRQVRVVRAARVLKGPRYYTSAAKNVVFRAAERPRYYTIATKRAPFWHNKSPTLVHDCQKLGLLHKLKPFGFP